MVAAVEMEEEDAGTSAVDDAGASTAAFLLRTPSDVAARCLTAASTCAMGRAARVRV